MKIDGLYFDIKHISDYRQELMGIAIIGVLIMHFFSIGEIERSLPVKVVSIIPSLAFTETFLFLSGLGIFSSLSRNSDVLGFYKKRLKRLVVPYILMAFVPVLLYVIINEESFWHFFYRLSTIDFWFGESTLGMWYVAVTIMLYVLAPWLYRAGVFSNSSRCAMALGGDIIILFAIYCISGEYWGATGVWLAQTPAFLMGGFTMHRINNKTKASWKELLGILVVTLILVLCGTQNSFLIPYSRIMVRVCGLIVLCVLFNYLSSCSKLMHILRWFGTYSLELYILHLLLFQPFKNMGIDGLHLISASIVLSLLLCQPVHNVTNKIVELWK